MRLTPVFFPQSSQGGVKYGDDIHLQAFAAIGIWLREHALHVFGTNEGAVYALFQIIPPYLQTNF